MGMGMYDNAPYTRGEGSVLGCWGEGVGAEVDLRVHHGDRGAGREHRLPTTPAVCGDDVRLRTAARA